MSLATGEPLFSIVTVVRNASETIGDCLQGIRDQDFRDFEYIVVDALSEDGTTEILHKNMDIIDLYIYEKDQGIYDAMNKAITKCNGRYIGIINADDYYLPQTLMNVKNFISRFPDGDVVYGGINILKKNETKSLFVDFKNLPDEMIPHPACFVKSSVYENVGRFDLKYRIAADYDFMLKCFTAGVKFRAINLVLANYRPGGASAKNRLISIQEMTRIQAEYLGWSRPYFLFKLLRYLAASYLNPRNLV